MVSPHAGVPRFSVVSAVYNIARYLDEFIESVERQTFGLDNLQVVMVNDGSTDDSLERLEAWQRRRPDLVTIVSKPNGGLPSARNAGLPHVRGVWVTFADPDDILDKHFFASVHRFLRKHPETMMVATRRMVFSDLTGEPSRHPLDGHFLQGSDRLRNLDYDSGHFHGHAASSFFRVDLLQRERLTFDERLRTTFEDGHFCNAYLLSAPKPTVGYVTSAEYHYRKRDDGTSQLDRSWADPGRFTDVLEHGYLALLRDAAQRRGQPPSWLQGMVIYELSWFFKINESLSAPTAAYGETQVRFHDLLEEICELLDDTGIQTYRATSIQSAWREMLQHGYKNDPWHTTFAVVDKIDTSKQMMRVWYRFTGDLPTEVFAVYSKQVEPVHQKIRDIRLFDRTMLHERIVWLPFGTVRVLLNGKDLDMRTSEPEPPDYRLTGWMIKKGLDPDSVAAAKSSGPTLTLAERMVLRWANTRLVRRYFRDAWVLIDRVFNADDSAEHLFRYLRKNRPNVNAWFVIERRTPDYRRLRRDGYGRVISHGSLRWKLLMLNCLHVISSHIDDVVVRPKEIRRLAEPRWQITFLQHGVIKDDLSTWLNRKNIDIFVTSTRPEFDSIVDDHTTYRYTTREVKLTGLPRFDRILEEGKRFPPEERDLIVIAPTWRQWLSLSESVVTGRHSVRADGFATSQYATEWKAVINSTELRELAERTGLTVALLLHPNFQDTAQLNTLPHVVRLRFEGQNVHEVFARARVLVTDYSSMFFNAAYIERPVVYFQFDRDRVNAGWHLGRRGYFDYERDGYGPVTLTSDEAMAAIIKTVESGPEPDPVYLDRIRQSFPERDGRCCERVADVIAESTQRTKASRRSGAGRTADGGRGLTVHVEAAGPRGRPPKA